MERSLDSIVEEIAQNDEMSREFAAMDEIDEIYQYCRDAGLDYSEEEFDEEVSALIGDFENSGAEISEFELSGVAGGRALDHTRKKWEGVKNSMNGETIGHLLLHIRKK